MDNSFKALGLMSGTSMDGIDASIIHSDGLDNLEIIDNQYFKYPKKFKDDLSAFINIIYDQKDIEQNIKLFRSLERKITFYHSEISEKIIKKNNTDIQLIGFHGQTVIHKPQHGYSIQMGDADLLSQILRKKVVNKFRENDFKNGGEGAPLTPIYHKLLSKKIKSKKPILFLNIGGVANFTYCYQNKLYAKDIGPGNVLIDEYLKKVKGIYYDEDGIIASTGRINHNIINHFYEHEFYDINNKRSFDRKEFDFNFIRGLEFEDAVSTLTYFTALTISKNIQRNITDDFDLILCGGGRKNLTLVKHIKDLLDQKIIIIDELGFDGDFIESQAFAYLSIRSYINQPLSFPSTTNVKQPSIGGLIKTNY